MASDRRAARLGVLALVATLLFGALGTRLWFLQTVDSGRYQEEVDSSRTRTVRIAPERGRIFDVDGRVLADNRGMLTVTVDWAAMRRDVDRATLFNRLSGWLEMPVEEMEQRFDSGRYSRYLPMPVAEDVPEQVAVALRERIEDFPGLEVENQWERVYPYAPLASHVVGYMGSITGDDVEEYEARGYDTSSEGEDVGASGVELSYEDRLHGQWGTRTYEVDSANRIIRLISETPAVNGEDLVLSIDLDLQYYAERLLITQLRNRRNFTASNPEVTKPNGTRGPLDPNLSVGTNVHYKAPAGSVVVMDQHGGQILAMASYPTFDNRWFGADLSRARFDELFPADIDPDESRLVNRAIQGRYQTGSTFKLFTAYAALSSGKLSAETRYDDQGTYQLSPASVSDCASGQVRCVFRNSICSFNNLPCVYGSVNTSESLAVSSDAFYYALGEQFYLMPGTPFQDILMSTFGFGEDPGVDLPFAYDGQIATNELQAELADADALGDDPSRTLQPGDLLQLAIGQGISAISPLQLAVGYAAVGNGGHVLTPHVVDRILAPETPDSATPGVADLAGATVVEQLGPGGRDIPMPDTVRGPLVDGLRRNITGPGLNGRTTTAEELFRVGYPAEAIPIAGKTGTAQGRLSYPWNDSSAFAAFSLDENRPFTVVSYLEKAGYGSLGAAPIVKCMYLALSGLVVLDPPPIAEPLDLEATVAAPQLAPVDTACMKSDSAPVRPVD